MSDELDRLARAAVPDVLAAAVDRARGQAVARLADLLTDAIVAQALAGTVAAPGRGAQRAVASPSPDAEPPQPRPAEAGPPQPRPPEAPTPDARAAEAADPPREALYAYGITWADVSLPDDVGALTEDTALRCVVSGDLALVVSGVRPEQLRVDEDDLSETGRLAMLARGHDAVVRAAAAAGPVLPLRFGTVVPDEPAARRLLQEHGPSAREQLRRIGDTREWGVKLVRRLTSEPTPIGARARDRTAVSGTEYLARRRQSLERHDLAEAATERAAELLHDSLRPHAAQSLHRGGSPGSSLLLDLAFLVSPAAEAEFLSAAAELRDRLEPDGLEVEVSGPWPPYSFAVLGDADA